jgi:hypothetical protein
MTKCKRFHQQHESPDAGFVTIEPPLSTHLGRGAQCTGGQQPVTAKDLVRQGEPCWNIEDNQWNSCSTTRPAKPLCPHPSRNTHWQLCLMLSRLPLHHVAMISITHVAREVIVVNTASVTTEARDLCSGRYFHHIGEASEDRPKNWSCLLPEAQHVVSWRKTRRDIVLRFALSPKELLISHGPSARSHVCP